MGNGSAKTCGDVESQSSESCQLANIEVSSKEGDPLGSDVDPPTCPPVTPLSVTNQPTQSSLSGPSTDPDLKPPAPSTTAQVITVSDLPALMRVLGKAPCSPRHLGIQLGLDPRRVDALEWQAMRDPEDFLGRVLQERLLNTPTLTLQDLLSVISRPPISDEDLAWRLQRDFINDVHKECNPTHASATPGSLSTAMADYSEYLDAVYETSAIPTDTKWGPSPGTKYTQLAVIKKEEKTQAEIDKFTKATLHGGIDEIVHKKAAMDMSYIFKPEEGQAQVNFVLVEGAPGVGKSTFAWELCRKRHEIEAMRAFSAVVLLRLREKRVKQVNSLADLVYHDNPTNEQAVADELRSNKGVNFLLILDGFDEVPASIRKSFFLAQVISGQYLPKATILVTSRPSARADILSLRTPDKHIEVIGFTRELIEEYASGIFGPNTQILTDFLTYIFTNPSIQSMMYIPLNCAMVVEIYQENREEGRPIPQTMTQLYTELVLTHMRRHLMEEGGSLPRRLENLGQKHPDVFKQLLSLAKLAFEATLKQEVIFEELPANCSTLGLLAASQQLYGSCKGLTNYNFIHLTVQEFLSAFYISQHPDHEQKRAFEWYSHSSHVKRFSHMNVVWRFVAGLTGFEGIGWELVRSRTCKENYAYPFLIQCLYEAQEKVDCKSILGESKVIGCPRSEFDCLALGYCVAASKCCWELRMVSVRGPESVEMLVCGLRSQKGMCGYIDRLNLNGSPIAWEGVAHFKKMPQRILQNLSYLDLPRCKLDGQALDLLSDIVPTMTSLKHLNITGNPAGDGETVKLLQTLAATNHLHTLGIRDIPLGRDDIITLSHLIRPSGSLKKLEIGTKELQPNSLELLLQTVLSPSSLQSLGLTNMNIDERRALVSFSPLKENCNITKLGIAGGTVRNSDICCIAEVLRCNTTLESLSIGDYSDVAFVGTGAVTVQSNTSQVTDSLRVLADALKTNRSLKKLAIDIQTPQSRDNRDSALGARALVDALHYNQTLECDHLFTPEELRATGNRVIFVL